MNEMVANRLEMAVSDGFDIMKISKVAFDIYQDPDLRLGGELDVALLSLMAMSEGPEFELTEFEFNELLLRMRKIGFVS